METITNFENKNLDQNLNPVTPQKNIFKILFFILLTLVLVIIIVLTTLLITKNKSITPVEELTTIPSPTTIPTQTIVDETANWKTYTSKNEYVDYNFIYPKTWGLLERSTNTITIAGDIDSDYNNKVANGVRVCGNYSITCYKNLGIYISGSGTYYNQPNTIDNYIYSEKQKFNEVQKTTINNQTAYSFYAAGMAPEIKKYFIERGDGAFCEISFCDKDLTTNENHFLNSFKFN